MKRGFTLVELSIVLVIIGLLIGGILAAQSMINTSKIISTVAQIGELDTAVMNFKTQYNYLPGDAPYFGGDGNGVISQTAGVSGATYELNLVANVGEISTFFNNLFPATYAAGNFSIPGYPLVVSGAAKNSPVVPIGRSYSGYIATAKPATGGSTAADIISPANYYAILHTSQVLLNGAYYFQPTTSANAAVKPADLLALDKKMDDGLADSGNVISARIINNACCGGSIEMVGAPACSTGSTYLVADSTYECTPAIRIGAAAGDPQ